MKIQLMGEEKMPTKIMDIVDQWIRVNQYITIDYRSQEPTNAGNWGRILARGEDFIVFEPDFGGREIVPVCNIVYMTPDDLDNEEILRANIKRHEHLAKEAREALERLKRGEYA